MSKKRYTLYLSRPLANKFDMVARVRNGAKSALFEEAIRDSLAPKPMPGLDDGLTLRLNEIGRATKIIERDVALATETLSLFVRYFLTITPPLPMSEQEPAHILGHARFRGVRCRDWPPHCFRPASRLRSSGGHCHPEP